MSVLGNIRELFLSGVGAGGRMRRRSYKTMAGTAHVYEIEYDDGNPVRVLNVRGTYQSATYLGEDCYELVFGYHRAYNAMFEACGVGLPIRHVAMLGGGGFSYPKYLVAHHPEISVDVVEIDPMVVAIAERWFYLDRLMAEFDTEATGRLRVFEEDARGFVEDGRRVYDAILNDCFSARVPVMSLATAQAAHAIHRRLAPGGLYLTNVISALRGRRAALLHAVMRTLQGEFAHVQVIPGHEGLPRLVDNYVVIASDGDYAFPHSIDIRPDADAELLVDARIGEYEREFFLTDV